LVCSAFFNQVAESRCWSCGLACQSKHDLQNHLHDVTDFSSIKPLWDDDRYLKPFMQDDSLLYNFGEFEEGEDEQTSVMDEDLVTDLKNAIYGDDQDALKKLVVNETASVSDDHSSLPSSSDKELVNGKDSRGCILSIDKDPEEGSLMGNPQNHIITHIRKVNESYFGSYSSFGIHREMLSDKV
jgi:protein arginine N-methyltransferase 3